jgi:hypothetical protein
MGIKKNEKSLKTTSKTLRLKSDVVDRIEVLADDNNRNFNNMAETLMRLGMEHYPGIKLNM